MTASQPSSGAAPRLARHLARCTPCREGLDAMSAQRGVLATIGRARGDAHLVDEVLAACAQDGREKLADLLYEMAHACVHLIPEDLAPGEVTKNPDPVKRLPVEVLIGTAAELCGRVPERGLDERNLPEGNPSPERAASIARTCLVLLEQVEGPSARRRFFEAVVSQFEGNHRRVIEQLSPMLSEELPEWLWLGVRWALIAAHLRREEYTSAAEFGEAALRVCPDDRALIYNTAAAYAGMGDGSAFDRTSHGFSSSRAYQEDLDWWQSFISDEADLLATELGRSRDSILQSLSLPSGAGGEAANS